MTTHLPIKARTRFSSLLLTHWFGLIGYSIGVSAKRKAVHVWARSLIFGLHFEQLLRTQVHCELARVCVQWHPLSGAHH